MTPLKPRIAVVVPTFNRCRSLRRLLDALARQTMPGGSMEVLVVSDGSTDDTSSMVAAYPAPFPLRLLEQASSGQATARNRGVENARSPLLLFLDDDVEPEPSAVAAHVARHEGSGGRKVVVGPYPPVSLPRPTLFQLHQRNWWDDTFRSMAKAGHRFRYTDLLGGNVSMGRDLFIEVGGFDRGLTAAREDGELGIRLLAAGATFEFAPEACARHHEHETMSPRKYLRRARAEGRADVHLASIHPEAARSVPALKDLDGAPSFLSDVSISLLAIAARGIAFATPLLEAALHLLMKLKLRSTWSRLQQRLKKSHYWTGAWEAAGGTRRFIRLRQKASVHDAPSSPPLDVDVEEGLAAARELVDSRRPDWARIWYRHHLVGIIPPDPGAEPLLGRHLKPLVLDQMGPALVEAVLLDDSMRTEAEARDVHPSAAGNGAGLTQAFTEIRSWFGKSSPSEPWTEMHRHWAGVAKERRDGVGQPSMHQQSMEELRQEVAGIEARTGASESGESRESSSRTRAEPVGDDLRHPVTAVRGTPSVPILPTLLRRLSLKFIGFAIDGAAVGVILAALPGISGPGAPVPLLLAVFVLVLVIRSLRPLAKFLTFPLLLVLFPFTFVAFHTGLLALAAIISSGIGLPVGWEELIHLVLGGGLLAALHPLQMALRARTFPRAPFTDAVRERWRIWQLRRRLAQLEDPLIEHEHPRPERTPVGP